MHQLIFFLLVVYNTANVQGQHRLFIGQGSNVFIAARTDASDWDWGINNCHTRNLMPGIIQTAEDYRIITEFLSTDAIIDIESRALWLAATDHKEEGTFQWLLNSEVVNGTWAPGMPSENRTANCLAINKEGQLVQESCYQSGRKYYTLCQAAAYNQETVKTTPKIDKISMEYDMKTTLIPSPLQLSIIGQVGNRMYFVDDKLTSWTESLDICHIAGMRLATPENPEEFQFLQDYAFQQAVDGDPNPIYYLGGTDRLAVDCFKTNVEYRWLYSGNPVANQTDLRHNAGYYQCIYMTPGGLAHTACITGAGAGAHLICEVTF